MTDEFDIGAEAITRFIRRGDTVCWGQGPAEPVALTSALMRQRHAVGPFRCFIGMGWTDTPDPAFTDVVSFASYCGTGTNRRLVDKGLMDILPSNYSELADLLPQVVDILMIQVAPTERADRFSFALACEYLPPLLNSSRLVIAEVNERAPVTHCETEISAEQIDVVVRTSREPPVAAPARSGDIERRIAWHVANLIDDGAVLQIGLGAVPESVLFALSGHRKLGVHSGMISDAVVDLVECGAIGAGAIVTGLLAGSRRLNAFAHRNPDVQLRSTAHTHHPAVLAGIQRLCAINSAIEVDLSGRVNAEMAGKRYVGAVGGLMDFSVGAHRSTGGMPIIALPSTARGPDGPVSRIVLRLNGPGTIGASLAGVVVTEFGAANLRGLSLLERHRKMIDIAHPDFRETLDRHAFELS